MKQSLIAHVLFVFAYKKYSKVQLVLALQIYNYATPLERFDIL